MLLRITIICSLIFAFSLIFFSYRLLETPRGITTDEAAFGYNASLISQTMRDENGRFLPVFVLSLNGRDWRQPLTQYLHVLTFKFFGPSLFNLKFSSVFVISISAVLVFILGKQLFNLKFGLLSLVIFITTPIVMIHSHLALDNIMPIPFILLWLIGLINFEKKKSIKYLVVSAFGLGVSFYAHKSMRSAATIWTFLTVLYLIATQIKKRKVLNFRNYRVPLIFSFLVFPFFAIAPILDYKYAGAVFGSQDLNTGSWYDFIFFYLSTFDLSFLFIKGDSIMHHSTGKHGMFLLSSLPLLVYGMYRAVSARNKFLIFLVICFFSGPILLGFIGSIHRASRLIFLVPLFTFISAFGMYELLIIKGKPVKIYMLVFILIFITNFSDFVKYYWYQYPLDTYHIFYQPVGINAYKKLDEISKRENLRPLIDYSLIKTNGDGGAIEDFARSLYFTSYKGWEGREIPFNTLLLSNNRNIPKMKAIETGVNGYYLYKKE